MSNNHANRDVRVIQLLDGRVGSQYTAQDSVMSAYGAGFRNVRTQLARLETRASANSRGYIG